MPVLEIGMSGPVICVSCSADGTKVAAGSRNGGLNITQVETNNEWQKQVDEGVHGLAIVGKSNKVACGGKDCKLRMYNSLGNIEWEQAIGKSIWSMSTDSNGQFIVIGTGDSISLFTEGGLQLWEYPTNRAIVGVGISKNMILGCGDEFLYCLDNDGNLIWKKQRSDSLWDVSIEKDSNKIFIGGWDCKVHCLDNNGNELWNYETGGYVRSVASLNENELIAGSHDGYIYRLSNSGELLEKFEIGEEITCISAPTNKDFVLAGFGNLVKAFKLNPEAKPILSNDIEGKAENVKPKHEEEYEPMFGIGMFDEPIPDSSGISSNYNSSSDVPKTIQYKQEQNTAIEGGEFREFAAEVIKGDVKNYLRLGNAAWVEKRLDRAEEHYKRATEVDPDEPRAWHNLAICNYHLALKRNPENIKGAAESAFALLEVAKQKGGNEYKAINKTLAYLASQLGLIEEKTD